MPRGGASPKRKGTDFERRVRRELIAKGYLVARSAGSLGVFDLIAIKPASEVRSMLSMLGLSHEQIEQVMEVFRKCVLGIQCKTNGRLCKVERAGMIELSERYNITPILYWREGRKLRWEVIE